MHTFLCVCAYTDAFRYDYACKYVYYMSICIETYMRWHMLFMYLFTYLFILIFVFTYLSIY